MALEQGEFRLEVLDPNGGKKNTEATSQGYSGSLGRGAGGAGEPAGAEGSGDFSPEGAPCSTGARRANTMAAGKTEKTEVWEDETGRLRRLDESAIAVVG